ncbi:MAG TPA: DUF3667 domain-containing protein [Frateuria sp.]|uniref:DUF3667 domain-containing protein n=1 Tax=Frateuria sp. TaxID=2211372 RepID=UPI002DEF917F|nr:DUF3667 domain-containing protein [Frateuria sp.]
MNELTDAGKLYCANCATSLEGEFCHHCGQSVHSVLKPVHHMLEDGMDMFLHVDGRIFHSVPPLLTKPGFLTMEYFSGRRQRYVAPFRLMFVLCLLAFFAMHIAVDVQLEGRGIDLTIGQRVDKDTFADADTPQEVRKELADQLRGLAIARGTTPAVAHPALDASERQLRVLADKRLAALGAPPLAPDAIPATGANAPAPQGIGTEAEGPGHVSSKLDGKKFESDWLPQFMNERVNTDLHRMLANFRGLKDPDPAARQAARDRLVTGVFSVLPQAMVVMIPIFALLLKLFYLFKRRLYMEHLIVALHSHAFLFLALLLVTLLGMLSTWLRPHAAWAGHGLGFLEAAVVLWMPAYLLVMQKRVYRQGWPMTLLKYWCVGWCYFWLLVVVLTVAAVMGAGH